MNSDVWMIAHAIFSLALAGMVVLFLVRWREKYSPISRFGLGLIGGCGIVRISVILEQRESPFDMWAPTLFTLGVVLFIFGCIERETRHERRNRQQVRQAEKHLIARGKL